MLVDYIVDDKKICTFEIWDDKVPETAKVFREQLPIRTVLQHAKLVGDQLFATLPFVVPWENLYLTEEIGRMRRAEKGTIVGTVCFYSPRQQLVMTYGEDLAVEPLLNSLIGEVVDGGLELALLGERTWRRQGGIVELRLHEESTESAVA
ncbi:DUF3830 family protein [Actinotalea sp. M2MS4P-6]|uniref:DUF3830 family protein n=1 Tax=Actinotalea sp. M2MS4P-6 TaxID=2983762 RepID=UPI0021E3BDB5|nr:DUF3830 family protein [Actinotalea sp. M2MS4P-6]MCV2394371.1 DUF3830 family protein [Actinotalea sp. M2MS4P-6]